MSCDIILFESKMFNNKKMEVFAIDRHIEEMLLSSISKHPNGVFSSYLFLEN